ncbi:uncharacterized protein EDB91DRAFT_1249531 [Suillus paluster]|uniref:uncharacterized protein n=1 Tax=Suillus paluster TaxID=48578 RepID=UPI001B867B91|nr:uncharacterized protein EDB91DRAFT_1249531 [Suillus paluster]KAG1737856.1 hypothetical protein EDB91DRAFT_1249531 [Suillus paluster]
MAKGKSGPPYTGRSAEYVVVSCPWGMNRVTKNRVAQDFDRLAAWIQYVLQDKGVDATVECIFQMGTRDEVIVQLPLGADIQPLLGEHKWAIISKKWDGDPNDGRASSLFEYNFRNNGDPSNHNWAEEYPSPLPPGSVPAKSPYPEPGWAEPPSSIRSLVLPVPPRPPTPVPESEPSQIPIPIPVQIPIPVPVPAFQGTTPLPPVSPPTAPANATSAFRPYEPPTQHPAHGTFIDQINKPRNLSVDQQSHQSSPGEGEHAPALKYIKKLDPYQEEEDTQALLRTPPRDSQSDSKPIKHELVKKELDFEPEYQPSSQLMDAISSLIQEQDEEQKAVVCGGSGGPLPGPSTSYQPSAELMDAIDSLIQEQNLDQKPVTKERQQNSHYQPSAELTDAINSLLQQSAASDDEKKPVPDPPRAHSPLILNHAIKPKSSAKQEKKYGRKKSRYVIQHLNTK